MLIESVLVVEDYEVFARQLANRLSSVFDPIIATTFEAATVAIASEVIHGAIIDVALPDGNGLDLVKQLATDQPDAQILVLSGTDDPDVINGAHLLGAEYVCKPDSEQNIRVFLCRVVSRRWLGESGQLEALVHYALEFDLSLRQAQILAMATGGVPRREIAGLIGISENTLKTQIRKILIRCNRLSLSEVVWAVHNAAGTMK